MSIELFVALISIVALAVASYNQRKAAAQIAVALRIAQEEREAAKRELARLHQKEQSAYNKAIEDIVSLSPGVECFRTRGGIIVRNGDFAVQLALGKKPKEIV